MMKEQCIKALGEEMYNKIYQYLKKNEGKTADLFAFQNELKTLIGNDKDKINKAFLIEQIIECEKGKSYFV